MFMHTPMILICTRKILNPLLDTLEAALAPSPITGIRSRAARDGPHADIAGKIETDEGVLGDQAIAIVPIEIFASEDDSSAVFGG